METKQRPTSVTQVDAALLARADFRGIDEAGRVHYLLGMCQAMLAQANTEIQRLERSAERAAQESK